MEKITTVALFAQAGSFNLLAKRYEKKKNGELSPSNLNFFFVPSCFRDIVVKFAIFPLTLMLLCF